MWPRRLSAAAAVVIGLTAFTGCGFGAHGLSFHNDKRLEFVQPASRAKITAPVTITWTMKDFDTTGLTGSTDHAHGAFVVFIDRAPMPAGKDLHWLARDDAGCKQDPKCPSTDYLAQRGIYVTTTPSVTIPLLPHKADGVGDEQHYVNVVIVDGEGRRIGESAWYRSFHSPRRSS